MAFFWASDTFVIAYGPFLIREQQLKWPGMLCIVRDLKQAEVYPLLPPLWYSDSRQGLPRRGGGLVPSFLVLVHFDRYNHRDNTRCSADDCSDHCYFCNIYCQAFSTENNIIFSEIVSLHRMHTQAVVWCI